MWRRGRRKEEGGRSECLSASEQGEMCRHRHRATCWAEVAEGRAEVVVVVVVVVVGSALARAGASSLHHSERHVTAAGARAEGCATAPREETTDRQCIIMHHRVLREGGNSFLLPSPLG